ncbi:hypothetical protein M5689_015603 [Euphorbia peplus]|nr:hypothetical protein M5689_015603 [Euphorbia peplus]
MSSNKSVPEMTNGRLVGGTEHSFCRALRSGGTGISVVAMLTTKPPDIALLENALHNLQNGHPILRSSLHSNPATNTFSISTSSSPFLHVETFSLSSTQKILENNNFNPKDPKISPFHLILEHELNKNSWCNDNSSSSTVFDMFFVSVYSLPDEKWAVVLRLHVVACDRMTAISVMNELAELMGEGKGGRAELESGKTSGKVDLAIEELIPKGKVKKTLWSKGVNVIGYSLSSLSLTNLEFKDTKSTRSSQFVRFKINRNDTLKILEGCKTRDIKLCGALGAAGLIVAQNSKNRVDKQRKYGIVTLTDCRALLDPPLSPQNFGFYHSAIMNTHSVKGGETLWDLAKKVYNEYDTSKKSNKHFTDMADLNYLMSKAIENPSLTSSSRTSFLFVFEDPMVDDQDNKSKAKGFDFDEYVGCASTHGIGPSLAIFDTIRDGSLDCVCVYPSPLHSREQMQEFVDEMKKILVDGCK